MSKLKVISGGQTGVDQAALRAAKHLGIPTGGWLPFGWKTEDGPRPDFVELYGMKQCEEPGYPARTERNVIDSHVTLWWGNTGSFGYRCTLKACGKHDRRLIHADYYGHKDCLSHLAQVSRGHRPFAINCAGGRESKNPGVGEEAQAFFYTLFEELNRRLV